MTGELTALGVDPDAERLYRRILRTTPADLDSHVAALGWGRSHALAAYAALLSAGLVSETSVGVLIPESPRVAIGRLIEQESARLDARRRELADAQARIADFANEQHETLDGLGVPPPIDQVPEESIVAAFEHAVRSTTGPIRHMMLSTSSPLARDDDFVRWAQGEVARGRVLRTLYPAAFLQDGDVRGAMWVQAWGSVGEQQRVLENVPHSFTVFGHETVLASSTWGEVSLDLTAVRSPMIVEAFIALFDESWRSALPVPRTTFDGEAGDRLISMLASGMKDEAIARYLGVSLRTVRRRVALLMDELGATTRFQLGSAAERRGLLTSERQGGAPAERASRGS